MKKLTDDDLTFKLSLSRPLDTSATARDWRDLPPPVVLEDDEPDEEEEYLN